ncbi:MAG TPA: histone-like nucleoid-structuring protein Lsr2 [Mycobacteriales bacterium]|nr:histone-like nucleoid-structuring protein Lsr2 [Mycobacteriales bacterium]
MADDFVIARNPDADSQLPYLLRIPLPGRAVVLKARETWPRTSKVYCHRADGWPADAEVVERVAVRSCTARGPAVDLVLDRGRENRSQLVFTRLKNGREAIFWQSARTAKKARPGVRTPSARASGLTDLEIVVDGRERYPYRFSSQQATAVRGSLRSGDYGVRQGDDVVAVVERKSLEDLAHSLVSGRLAAQLAELASFPRAAVVVEERYSRLFSLPHVKPGFVADLLARVQVRWPAVPVFFAETRPLAEEWTYRFLAAALAERAADARVADRLAALVEAQPLAPAAPRPADIRRWAAAHGMQVAAAGRVPASVVAAYTAAHAAADV